MLKMRGFHILFFALFICFSCHQEEVSSNCTTSPGLQELSSFPIGIAVDMDFLDFDPEYERLLNQQFGQLTPGNIFKPSNLQPAEGQFYFDEADRLLAYADLNGKALHGHTLLWHQQLPQWMEDFEGSPAEWEAMLKNHIQSVVGHFKGRLRAWDVVNEAFDEDGSLRETIWKQHLGASYIEKAFRYAHAADPDALLFLNDYNLALSPRKRRAMFDLVKDFQRRGVPIHGIGLQMHISLSFPSDAEIGDCLKDASQLGLPIHLSELDISVNPLARNITFDENLAQRQARKGAYVLSAYQKVPAALQYGITFWGLSDRDSWIPSYFGRDDYPLLFDRDYQTKPMYCQFKALLNP